jgi:cellulose synthase/poly-beta-1,6-N-acetylglucosamine synthase-like glycosyltransferase
MGGDIWGHSAGQKDRATLHDSLGFNRKADPPKPADAPSPSTWHSPATAPEPSKTPRQASERFEIGVRPFFQYLAALAIGSAVCFVAYTLYLGNNRIVSWFDALLWLGGGAAAIVGGIGVAMNLAYVAFCLIVASVVIAVLVGLARAMFPHLMQ